MVKDYRYFRRSKGSHDRAERMHKIHSLVYMSLHEFTIFFLQKIQLVVIMKNIQFPGAWFDTKGFHGQAKEIYEE